VGKTNVAIRAKKKQIALASETNIVMKEAN
jgi:hypothetical protein